MSPGIEWTPGSAYSARLYYTFENQWQPSLDASGAFNPPGTINRPNVASHLIDWQNEYEMNPRLEPHRRFALAEPVGRPQPRWGGRSGGRQSASPRDLRAVAMECHRSLVDHQRAPLRRLLGLRRHLHLAARSELFESTGTDLFASIARSVAPPTAQDLFFLVPPIPNLRPEESLSFEAGIQQRLVRDKVFSSMTFSGMTMMSSSNPMQRPDSSR